MLQKIHSVAIVDLAITDQAVPSRSRFETFRRSPLVVNLLSVGIATIAGRALGLITLGYPARTLGPDNYGMAGYAASVVAYAGILQSSGLPLWGTRAVARDATTARETLYCVTAIRVILGLLAYAALATFAALFVRDPLQRNLILISGATILTTAFSADWALCGLGMVQIPAWIGVLGTGLNVCALLLFVRSASAVLVYCALAPTIGLVTGAIIYVNLRLFRGITARVVSFNGVLEVARAAAPLGFLSALVVVLHYSNNLIIYSRLGAHELGIFLASYKMVELATLVPGLLGSVFFPKLMKTVASDIEAARRGARMFAQVHIIAAFCVAAILAAEAATIVHLIYGAKYDGAIPLLRIMAVAVVFNYAICGYTNCLISFGRDRVMIMVVCASALVSVGGGLILVPVYGLWGAALVITCIDLAGWLVSLRTYRTVIGSLNLDIWIRPMLGGLLAVCSSLFLQSAGASIWIRVPIMIFAYTLVVLTGSKGLLKR